MSYAPACRPLLLLLDGHSSHFSPEVIRTAAAEGVIVFALPPHTTHLCQPLDKGAFAPLKVEWRKVVQGFMSKSMGRSVTRYDFSELFKKAWSNAMTLKIIVAGFRVTGICPFDRNAFCLPCEEPTKFNPEALPQSTGIKYIPLYSPTCSGIEKRKPTPVFSPVHSAFGSSFLCHPSSCSRDQLGWNSSVDDTSLLSNPSSVDKSLLELSVSEPCLQKHSLQTEQFNLVESSPFTPEGEG